MFNKLFNSCIFGNMTPAKKIVCSTLGITSTIVLIPTLVALGVRSLSKLDENTTIVKKISKINLFNRTEYSNWKYDYPKSYAGSFFVGGIFSSYMTRIMVYPVYHNYKDLFFSDTCCRRIRGGFISSFLILGGLFTSVGAVFKFRESYSLFKYYHKYKNEDIWGYNESWYVRMDRKNFETEYRYEIENKK